MFNRLVLKLSAQCSRLEFKWGLPNDGHDCASALHVIQCSKHHAL